MFFSYQYNQYNMYYIKSCTKKLQRYSSLHLNLSDVLHSIFIFNSELLNCFFMLFGQQHNHYHIYYLKSCKANSNRTVRYISIFMMFFIQFLFYFLVLNYLFMFYFFYFGYQYNYYNIDYIKSCQADSNQTDRYILFSVVFMDFYFYF